VLFLAAPRWLWRGQRRGGTGASCRRSWPAWDFWAVASCSAWPSRCTGRRSVRGRLRRAGDPRRSPVLARAARARTKAPPPTGRELPDLRAGRREHVVRRRPSYVDDHLTLERGRRVAREPRPRQRRRSRAPRASRELLRPRRVGCSPGGASAAAAAFDMVGAFHSWGLGAGPIPTRSPRTSMRGMPADAAQAPDSTRSH
jgi:hypothetical protein